MVRTRTMPLPLQFRYHFMDKLIRLIQAGESMVVLGVASVGKSNVVQYLQQADVQQRHFSDQASQILITWVDSNDLTVVDTWHFFELLLYRLWVNCQAAHLSTDIIEQVDQLHRRLMEQDRDIHAQRCFEEAIRWLCQVHDFKVVLLFDEFDMLFQELDPRLFANLRSLRDKNKYNLIYTLFLRQHLPILRSSTPEIEAFVELFQKNVLYLTPYNFEGAELMLTRLSQRENVTWLPRHTKIAYELSGGQGGLLRVVFKGILAQRDQQVQIDDQTFFADTDVRVECQKIWDSLSEHERQFLSQDWFSTTKFDDNQNSIFQELINKGLIQQTEEGFTLFAALFADFVQQKSTTDSAQTRFKFDQANQICIVEGTEILLTPLQTKLLELLYNAPSQTFKRIEILQHLYPDEDHTLMSRPYEDPRLSDIVKNLRKKIEPNPQKPHYLKTVRGLGFKLVIE